MTKRKMTTNEIYGRLLVDLYRNGDPILARGFECKEIRNVIIVIDDLNDNIITLPKFETRLTYATEELNWYIQGSNRIDYSELIHRVWKRYSDDGKTVNSNYGHRIWGHHNDFPNQWLWVLEELDQDAHSRRAVINLNYPGDKQIGDTKDFVCTMYIQCFIRDGALHWTVNMRSNDVYYGFRNDLYAFTSLQKIMADSLGVDYGTYTHFVGSMHLYQKDYNKVRRGIEDGTLSYDKISFVEFNESAFSRVWEKRVFGSGGAPAEEKSAE